MTMDHTNRAHLFAAAGLLHDVGKLLEPARIELHDAQTRIEQMACPTDKDGRSTHRHVLYTALAIDQANSNWGGLPREHLFGLAVYHHRPTGDDLGQHLMQAADWLASGNDRRAVAEDGGEEAVTALQSPFALVFGVEGAPDRFLPTAPLSFGEASFLPRSKQTRDEYRSACAAMSEPLLRAIARPYDSPADCVERLLAITQRFLHAVPSSRWRREIPDVSLFDHGRAVAAFAACLAVQFTDGSVRCDANTIIDAARFRLVGFRLRHIQRFIFRMLPRLDERGTLEGASEDGRGDSGERGLARSLRARSFYLSLLTTVIGRRILHELGLPAVNLLLDAGGRAYMLVPATSATDTVLERSLVSMRAWVREHLLGTVGIDFAVTEPLSGKAFLEDRFASTWRAAVNTLEAAGTSAPFDGLSGTNSWSDDDWVEPEAGLPVDRDARGWPDFMKRLGGNLPFAKYLSIDDDGASEAIGPPIEIAGFTLRLHKSKPARGTSFAMHLSEDPAQPFLLVGNLVPVATSDDISALAERSRGDDVDADDERAVEGRPLTLTHLANLSRADARAAPDDPNAHHRHAMLVALKADVDHLGRLMAWGLDARADTNVASRLSIGRLASLSRSLDVFFKGFLDARLRETFRRTYTVFAGGDDLFLIGPWHDMVRLAGHLQAWFAQFACRHPSVTISAGVAFGAPKTPIRVLAGHAEDSLQLAKDGGRDRVAAAGALMTWPELAAAMDMHRELLDEVDGSRGELQSSLVYRLLQYGQMAGRIGDRCAKATDVKWRAQMSYDLKRNLDPGDEQKDKARHDRRLRLHRRLVEIKTPVDAARLRTAAMLTLYSTRGGRGDD